MAPASAAASLVTERDAALGQVVGGNFDGDLVAEGNTDEILAHFTRDVAENGVAVLQLDTIHRAGEEFLHRAFQLNRIFFGHNRLFCNGSRPRLHRLSRTTG